jgi:hypothetical protein
MILVSKNPEETLQIWDKESALMYMGHKENFSPMLS